ncbi:MAG: insecticidal toxin protein [Candidatus Methylumidiphilus alinenensis]|uniref:Insecticidal toxin protein n=1 Tax=Candidatus Methylumidiphilus alinenensis TaxID=2202197 RepID=A0A2W4R4A2_9GAMM|nr:MAG: insecticidal toxin protein [Candidatus Methylumidiphilus alinenensis]
MFLSKSFHNMIDADARAHQLYVQNAGWTAFPTYISFERINLNYQFFPHFHPYVAVNRAAVPMMKLSLLERLKEGGLPELEDSDTLYMPQPNPPPGQPKQALVVIPNSTRASLSASIAALRPSDNSTLALTAGTPLTLADNTLVTVPKGTLVYHADGSTSNLAADTSLTLPGQIPFAYSSGIQITGTGIIVPDFTAVTLPNGASSAVLTADGSQLNLPNGTVISLRSGLPLPFFYEGIFDNTHYNPSLWVQQPYPVKNLDFSSSGAYSIYNWELFFHFPLLVAVHLSQNQKFQDAQKWFHYIFDPTDNSLGPTPERFWKVQPFQYTDVRMIQDILVNLSKPQDPQLYAETINSIASWQSNPFQPWAVAKFRPTAYRLKTVMAYLDNLIAWGDSLFQQYTIETINEATQIYIMAANILGPKPQAVPNKGAVKALTYGDLRGKLDGFGNSLVEMEVDMPFDMTPTSGTGTGPNGSQILPSIGQTLYFCIPRNDQFLAYWDKVADRLFKIHNSLNLQGVFQRLPLYDPPIDPALLVRAAAAGLDVSAIVSGLNQPLPLVRFQLLISKATEICQEVISLGSNLLSAIEKQDNESISLLRAQHENKLLQLAEMIKYSQWQDAQKSTQALQLSLATAIQRYSYYQKLLGRTDAQIQASIPQLDALDTGSLQNLNFSQLDSGSEPQMSLDPISPDISLKSTSVSDGEFKTLSNHEVGELKKLGLAHDFQETANGINVLGSVLALIPQFKTHVQPMGCGATIDFGGHHLSFNSEALASAARAVADQFSYEAGNAAKLGSYSRRELDWTFQGNTAKAEINQIIKQIRGAQIREAIANQEYTNHQAQTGNAQQIIDFLEGNPVEGVSQVKETTVGFYAWMKREVKALYANAFQLAFEVAKKSERALQNEIGDSSLAYIRYNYLDGNEGLLAGEKLFFDIKTMEMAYHDLNQREYELTKHVSLLQIDPIALIQLRATGSCAFTVPEEAFDLDCPGHYFRRIKSVALTIPCVAGPYTSVNCTLSLQNSAIRTNTDLPGNKYYRQGPDDKRFNDYYGTLQSIVTSSAQSDSGLFETNLRDERYLPFEYAGAVNSQWQITLPSDVQQFDFDTITDVVLHIRYTAREGGDVLKAAAVGNLNRLIKNAQTVGSVRLFSVRHEFPSQWSKFKSVAIGGAILTTELQLSFFPELYPFWSRGRIVGSNQLKAVEFFAEMPPKDTTASINMNDKADKTGNTYILARNPLLGNLLVGSLPSKGKALPAAITDSTHPPLTLYFDNNVMEDLWLAITWGI